MKKQLASALMMGLCTSLNANVIQYFTGISYSNPAALFQTKDKTLILGGTFISPDLRFRGTSLDFLSMSYPYGEVHSKKKSVLPYARVAKRVSPKLVLGLDITQPFHSNLDWGTDSFTNYAATQNYLYDVDISPRFSAALTEQLFFGFGFNLNYLYRHEANWAIPTSPTSYANLINKSSHLGVGYNVGLFYLINQQNFIGLSYYSKILQQTAGSSYLGPMTNTNLDFDFNMPATAILDYTHLFNEKWLANAKFFYSQWHVNQSVSFLNTAAPPPAGPNFKFMLEYRDSWALQLATHYQHNDKLGFLAFAMYDTGPEKDHLRPLIFPADVIYFAGIGIDYKATPSTTIELIYGHGWEGTTLNNRVSLGPTSVPFSRGNVNINADVIDLKVKVEV